MDAGGTEEERVDVPEGVSGVEASVVDDGRGDHLLTELDTLPAQTLDEVGKEDVDLLKVVHVLHGL